MNDDDVNRGRRQLEEIIGLGRFDVAPEIPGTVFVPGREFRYVNCDNEPNLAELFRRVTGAVQPTLAKSGAVVTENCVLTIPDGGRFFALSYKGDIEGWREQIGRGAKLKGKLLAQIEGNVLAIEDGRSFPLAECVTEFVAIG